MTRTFRAPYAASPAPEEYRPGYEYIERQKVQRAIPSPFVQSISADTVLTGQDDSGWFLVDATAGAITLSLPIASTAPAMTVTVKKTDSSANGVVVSRTGTDLIDGATSTTITTQYGAVVLRSTGAGSWELLTPATAGTITLTGNVTGSGTSSIATTIAAGVVTNAMLAAPISFANGGLTGSAATSATTGTMTVSMTTAIVTITPTGDCTFNASGGVVGQRTTFAITTSGGTSFTLTFGTNFHKTGTLATGFASPRFFAVTFVCVDGTTWWEEARTAVQT